MNQTVIVYIADESGFSASSIQNVSVIVNFFPDLPNCPVHQVQVRQADQGGQRSQMSRRKDFSKRCQNYF